MRNLGVRGYKIKNFIVLNIRSIHITGVLLCIVAGLMLSSCIYDSDDAPGSEDAENGVQFIFSINTLGADESQRQGKVVETVKSLRIIVIDKESRRLDINERLDLPQQYSAKNFSYIFIRSLKNPGAKQVYLVANEESVGEVFFTGDSAESAADMPTTSLKAMLDYFAADTAEDGEENYTGGSFIDLLDRVYFKNSCQIANGETALPYSAYYELDESDLYDRNNKPLTKIEKQMYLVPVAAKFDFVFTNFRKETACIEDVIISSVNSHNYLNAMLDDSEKRRSMPDGTQNVWWIDWLEACAAGSQTADDTDEPDGYNGRWGWIRNYKMPVEDEEMRRLSLRSLEDEWRESEWKVGKLVNIKNPSSISKGPYYVPESFNRLAGAGAGDLRQYYSLTFKVRDDGSDEVQTLEDYEIDTLGALFRDTHIIIYVEFYESEAEIYAEIAPWEQRVFLGYVQQDDDY